MAKSKLSPIARAEAKQGLEKPLENNTSTGGHVDGIPISYTKERYLVENLGVSQSQAEQLVTSVENYTGVYYRDIREYQQSGEPKEAAEYAQGIENYIKVAPKWDGGVTYRGISDIPNDVYEQLTTKGNVIDMKGTSSWSSRESVARNFAGMSTFGNNIVFVSETQSRGTSIRHLSTIPHEDEVVASKDASYVVKRTKKDKKSGIMYVYLKEM